MMQHGGKRLVPSRSLACLMALAVLVLGTATPEGWAQFGGGGFVPGGGGTFIPGGGGGFGGGRNPFGGPAGIEIDPNGVVKNKKLSTKDLVKLKKFAEKDAKFGYISLTKLLKDVEEKTKAGNKIPDDLRFLKGMVKVQFVMVYPDKKDIVLGGWIDEYHVMSPLQAIGLSTGRPVLTLDDLVVALRMQNPTGGRRPGYFGCSIDMTQEGLNNVQAAIRKMGAVRPSQVNQAVKVILEALGPQTVRIMGCPDNTPFAFKLIAADYVMKELAGGNKRFPKGIRGVGPHRGRGSLYNRWWFVPAYDPILVSDDGLSYGLPKSKLALKTSTDLNKETGGSASAKKFADGFTKNWESIAQAMTVFGELENLTDLAVVATVIHNDGLATKAGVDLSWILDESGFEVTKVTVPKKADPVVSISNRSIGIGGVVISPYDVAKNRTEKESKFLTGARGIVPEKQMMVTINPFEKAKETTGTVRPKN